MPEISRRHLFGAAAAVGATTALGSTAPAAAGGGSHGAGGRVPRDQISVQLYTLRNQLGINLETTFTELAAIGYRRVEHAGFVGRTAAQFRAALNNAGLKATSGHAGIPQPWNAETWKRTLDDAAIVGNKYIVHPYFGTGANGPIRDAAVYQAFAADLNKAGELARRAGLSFGYHNHHNEFLRQSGTSRTGFDILTGETDERLVHLEVDLYWAWRGAADPIDLIEKNRRRIKQVHVKDMDVNSAFADPGTGLIDFERIFRRAKEAGLIEYIVERDDAGSPPRTPAQALDTARVGYQYLSGLRF
ncbi:sugar phosphate isomerase/epimerase family protein [Actinoplanes couchii]|uniref:Xylose isomerase n=1 Tax=Actinoplanes couchii TaxID=403638 RepID=A0ABQ3XN97_9ACTN|nr:sugar phosphate isomerase/epimerase [Actinoplanes couchii]MDR6318141.1 sugar phosphate isomerase/epimerase [Actinoplanes couchii]GID59943.1 xylose isomerase [Actinoplanes couchii]